jgi:hypothetical protein
MGGGPVAGANDAWLARYDSDGVRVWLRQFGTPSWDSVNALATDGAGGAFAAGTTGGSLAGPIAGIFEAWLARFPASICYADCDHTGELDFLDFLCFLNQFAGGDPEADCNRSGILDFLDFLCFQNQFAAGCP